MERRPYHFVEIAGVSYFLTKISQRAKSVNQFLSCWLHAASLVKCDYRWTSEAGKARECFLFVFSERDVTSQPKHLKKFNGLVVHIGKNKARFVLLGNVDNAQKN